MRYPNPFFKERFLQHSQGVQPLGRTMRPRQWVVARSLCYFKVFDLSSIERRERRNALNVKIMQWSPFQETGHYILHHHDDALVWIWDATAVQNAMYAQGVTTAQAVPEPLVLEPLREDGFRLVSCVEGHEGQYWKEGMIVASRWWPKQPDARQLAVFMVSNDLPEQPGAAVQEVEYLSRPWPKRFNLADLLDVKRESFWVRAGVAAAVIAASYLGYQYQYTGERAAAMQQRLERVESQAAPVKAAQNRIRSIYEKYMSLYETVSGISQLELLYAVHQALPGIKDFKEWQYFEEKVFFVAGIPELKPRDIVARLQKNPAFENISVEEQDKTMYSVTFRVAHEPE